MTSDKICSHCGEPVISDYEFFRDGSGQRVWIHSPCMLQRGRELMASGKYDDVRMALDWGDGTVDLRTGKQVREKWPD